MIGGRMTKRSAERLTGYEFEICRRSEACVRWGLLTGSDWWRRRWAGPISWHYGPEYTVYFSSTAGWRFTRGKKSGRLEVHHRKYRSHGGTHRGENLQPDCHKLIHRQERSQ